MAGNFGIQKTSLKWDESSAIRAIILGDTSPTWVHRTHITPENRPSPRGNLILQSLTLESGAILRLVSGRVLFAISFGVNPSKVKSRSSSLLRTIIADGLHNKMLLSHGVGPHGKGWRKSSNPSRTEMVKSSFFGWEGMRCNLRVTEFWHTTNSRPGNSAIVTFLGWLSEPFKG